MEPTDLGKAIQGLRAQKRVGHKLVLEGGPITD